MAKDATVAARLRELGERLRGMRELGGLSIQDSAPVIDVSYATLSNIERGQGKLKDGQLELLEAFYGKKIDERLARVIKSLEPKKL